MASIKRCPFCGKKLDSKRRCQNKNCADYERTKIVEEQESGSSSPCSAYTEERN